MSGREASELLILKAELKNYKQWYFDCVKQLEQVKRERDAAMKARVQRRFEEARNGPKG